MNEREFCYWLQGFFEIGDLDPNNVNGSQTALTPAQATMIRDHLKLVFTKVMPVVNIPQMQVNPQQVYDNAIKGYLNLPGICPSLERSTAISPFFSGVTTC